MARRTLGDETWADRQAFARLVQHHQQPLAGYLWALGTPRDRLESLLIETFVAAYSGLQERPEALALRAWLFGIATRLILQQGQVQPERCLLVLRCLEGFSYAEIAAMLSMPSAAVKRQVRRAKARFI